MIKKLPKFAANYLYFAKKITLHSGRILLSKQEKAKVVKQKDTRDIATSADIASENYLINKILKRYPDHGILSEERGEINKYSKFRWVIDPLDGTKEFIKKVPLFNVSVALEYEKETIVSCVYRPSENVLYSAAEGLGSFHNDTKIKVSSEKNIKNAFVYCYLPSYHRNKEKYDWSWKTLGIIGKKVYRLRALADENTALCWLAQGGIEAYLNLGNPPKWHDIAPGLFISKEAGSIISDSKGNNIKGENIKSLVVSNCKSIHNQLLKILNY